MVYILLRPCVVKLSWSFCHVFVLVLGMVGITGCPGKCRYKCWYSHTQCDNI